MQLELEFQKRYTATYCIYKSIDTRARKAPRFLYRNLRDSLTHKADELRQSRGRRTVNSRTALPKQDIYRLVMEERAQWIPDADQLDRLSRPAALTIQPRQICLRGTAELDKGPSQANTSLPWLPETGWQSLACDITCALSQNNNNTWSTLWQATHRATLLCATTPEHGARVIFQDNAPFVIPASSLHRQQMQRRNSTITDQSPAPLRTVAAQRIRLQVSCVKPSAVRDLDTVLFGDSSHPDRTILKSVFLISEDLKTGTISRDCDLDAKELKDLVMRVDFDYSAPAENDEVFSLVHYKKKFLGGLLKRSESAEVISAPKAYRIKYVFAETDQGPDRAASRSVTVSDLACPLCPSKQPHTSFERLSMHYKLSHDHFRFDLHEQREVDGVLNVTFRIELQDPCNERISNDTMDQREMLWVRPTRPFDMDKFLKGKDTWDTGAGPAKKAAHKAPAETVALQPLPAWGAKAPEAVESIEPQRKKRFTVPQIPGVVLYRSLNKRKLQAGEELSESDEYSDTETWAYRKQRKRTPPIMGHSRGAFFDLWDTFVRSEKTPSDVHVNDATVRFSRKYKRQLRSRSMNKDFRLKLQQLQSTGRITQDIRYYCEELVEEEDDSEPVLDEAQKKREIRDYCDMTEDSDLDEPPEVYGSTNPLTYHPKVQALLNGRAKHPEVNPYLAPLVLGGDMQDRPSTLAINNLNALAELQAKCDELTQGEYTNGFKSDDSDAELPAPSTKSYHQWTKMLNFNSAQPIRQIKKPVKMRGGLCVCGRAAAQDRGVIFCSNDSCNRGAFHLACVNLEKRDPNWTCKGCSKGTTRERSTEWVTKTEEGAVCVPPQANGH